MQETLIFNVIGRDEPGVVESVSAAVQSVNGNWQSSRMTTLSGQFVGIVQISLARDRVAEFEESLERVAATRPGVKVDVLHRSSALDSHATTDEERRVHLEIIGQDRTGIVSSISHLLAESGVNVVELSTDCKEAPWAGGTLFHTQAKLDLASDTDEERLLWNIESLADDLMVDLSSERKARLV